MVGLADALVWAPGSTRHFTRDFCRTFAYFFGACDAAGAALGHPTGTLVTLVTTALPARGRAAHTAIVVAQARVAVGPIGENILRGDRWGWIGFPIAGSEVIGRARGEGGAPSLRWAMRHGCHAPNALRRKVALETVRYRCHLSTNRIINGAFVVQTIPHAVIEGLALLIRCHIGTSVWVVRWNDGFAMAALTRWFAGIISGTADLRWAMGIACHACDALGGVIACLGVEGVDARTRGVVDSARALLPATEAKQLALLIRRDV